MSQRKADIHKVTIKQRLSSWVSAYLLRRHRASDTVLIERRRIYILPTRAGLVYGVMLLVLLLCSINYSLSLGFGLTFLLAACGCVDMVLTYRNMAGLSASVGRIPAVFAGEIARLPIQLDNRRARPRYALRLTLLTPHAARIDYIADIDAHAHSILDIGVQTTTRGWHTLPAVRLHTHFPLGLLRAWSDWQPVTRILVYPQPEQGDPPFPVQAGGQETGHGLAGQDDFAGIRAYQNGDSMRHMAWRQIARKPDGNFVTKQFEGGKHGHLHFDDAELPATLDTELKLSRMTRWLLMAEAAAQPYAFSLGGTHFAASLGPVHLHACLHLLATHAQHDEQHA